MRGRPRVLVAPTSTDNSIVVMRELGRAGIDVTGADDGYLPAWLRSRHCRQYVRVPAAADLHVQDYLPVVAAAVRPDAIVPVNTPATVAAIRLQASAVGVARMNIPSAEAFAAAYDKRQCMAACRQLGIPCPRVYETLDAAALLRRGDGTTRLVVKPRFDFGGGHGLRIVQDAAALQAAVADCEHRLGGAVIQEFIPGDTGRLAMLLVLFGPDARLVAAFTSRKLRQHPRMGGSATVSESTAEPRLLEQMLPLFDRWRWAGPAEVDLKFDERDGTFKVLEVNPRMPSYVRFVVDCGLNLPVLAGALALAPAAVEPLPYPAYAAGRRYVCLGPFARGLLDEMREPGRRWQQLRRALGDVRGARLAGFWEDPLPFIGRVVHWDD